MAPRAQHTCSTTAFEPFPDGVLERSIPHRFAEQVARHRDCVALSDGGRAISYGELDEWSNGVARAIVAAAPGSQPIAILLEQGAGYAAAVLGTLKTGRPYVPLDPRDPAARLRRFVDGCEAVAVIVDAETRDSASGFADGIAVVDVDVAPNPTAPPAVVGPDDVAYVFFTSGSTGEPKGVYDSHRNVLHNVLRYTNALEIAPTDRLTLLQGPAFSGCVSSQFVALLNGATSLPFRLPAEGLLRAAEWLREERATIYHSVPSIFRAVAAHGTGFPDVRIVRLEGDRATSEDVVVWKRHFSRGSLLANGLGTTETGLARQLLVRYADTPERGPLPVGYPVRDVTAFVVDADRVPLPDGEVGEIAVAGEYLALGYWNRPDLTAQRFATHDGTRVYFTGDLGRLTADGCLEYLGRREGDVKVLGTRVEPAEIERELLRLDGVHQAAVAVREGARGDGRVVAYVVPETGTMPTLGSVRAALEEHLPAVALPTALVELDALPLGASGKLERRALPDPPLVAKAGELDESWLASIWTDVLGVAVGSDDDFFALGGDSLAAAEIVARVETETGRLVPLGTLIRNPTVAALTTAIAAADDPSPLTVLREGRDDATPLLLIHGNTGNALHYAQLVARATDSRPLWALEYPDPRADLGVEAIVTAHLETLRDARPSGPYLVAGFCYGSVIAHELGCRLAADGHEIGLALLGVTPLEFPTVVTREAREQWDGLQERKPLLTSVRHHVQVVTGLPRREIPGYAWKRLRSVTGRARRRAHATPEPTQAQLAQAALGPHRPQRFPGTPLVVLHELDTALYTADAETEYRALGTDGIELLMLPGSDHAMLEHGVDDLVAVLEEWSSRPH